MNNRFAGGQGKSLDYIPPPTPKTAQTTAAEEILILANEVETFAADIKDRVHSKLQPIMFPPRLTNEKDEIKPLLEYPPLFGELRARFSSINDCLLNIEEALNRTAL